MDAFWMALPVLLVAFYYIYRYWLAFRYVARRWRAIPFYEQQARRRKGLCATCGYDLRATPGRCPECGTVPQPPSAEKNSSDPSVNSDQDLPMC